MYKLYGTTKLEPYIKHKIILTYTCLEILFFNLQMSHKILSTAIGRGNI